jgi:hypothetical protein
MLHKQHERKGLEVEESSETQRPELKNLHIHWLWYAIISMLVSGVPHELL